MSEHAELLKSKIGKMKAILPISVKCSLTFLKTSKLKTVQLMPDSADKQEKSVCINYKTIICYYIAYCYIKLVYSTYFMLISKSESI